jgi:hypothetical protein
VTEKPTSSSAGHDIEQFFTDFEAASRDQDWARYGDLFLSRFLSLDPASAGPVDRDDLIAFLPTRKQIFDRSGATDTVLSALVVEDLDDHHVLARTTWDVVFDHDRAPAVLESTFILRLEDRWRIAVYLNHGSLLEVLGLS